jgi:hypothetical protein
MSDPGPAVEMPATKGVNHDAGRMPPKEQERIIPVSLFTERFDPITIDLGSGQLVSKEIQETSTVNDFK